MSSLALQFSCHIKIVCLHILIYIPIFLKLINSQILNDGRLRKIVRHLYIYLCKRNGLICKLSPRKDIWLRSSLIGKVQYSTRT